MLFDKITMEDFQLKKPEKEKENINFDIDEKQIIKEINIIEKNSSVNKEIIINESIEIPEISQIEDENEIRRRKTLEALEKRLSLKE